MNARRFPRPEDLGRDLEAFFRQLAGGRLTALGESGEASITRQALLEHEALRLKRKLGPDDPRTLRALQLAESGRALAGSLADELEQASVEPAQLLEGEALVEGRLVDEDGRGLDGLVVRLENAAGQPVGPESLQAETGRAGYYALRVDKQALEGAPELVREGAFLVVRTTQGELVERTPKPVQLAADTRLNLSAALRRAEAYQPGAVRGQGQGGGKAGGRKRPNRGGQGQEAQAWRVRGQVLDARGRPAEGLLVKLFDQDRRYDDRLDAVTTNAEGEFEFTFQAQDFREGPEPGPDLFLRVLDAEGNILYTSERSVRFDAGQEETFEVRLPARKGKGQRA